MERFYPLPAKSRSRKNTAMTIKKRAAFFRSPAYGIYGILFVVIDMDIDKKLIGKRIRHRREVSGLSQEQLAEKLELSTNHISSMECGKSLLTTKRLLALCDILGGTPNYYLVGEITPDADEVTTLVRQLLPNEQKMLCRLLTTYLENAN